MNLESNDKAKEKLDIFLDKYCKKHKITPEEAKEHQLVKDVKAYYEKES